MLALTFYLAFNLFRLGPDLEGWIATHHMYILTARTHEHNMPGCALYGFPVGKDPVVRVPGTSMSSPVVEVYGGIRDDLSAPGPLPNLRDVAGVTRAVDHGGT